MKRLLLFLLLFSGLAASAQNYDLRIYDTVKAKNQTVTGALIAGGHVTGSGIDLNVAKQDTSVATIAQMQAYAGTGKGVSVRDTVQGGFFSYQTGAYTADGGTILAATGKGSGYWIRQYHGPVDVRWYGADNTGATDCAAAVNNALGRIRAMGGGTLYFPRGKYTIASQVTTQSQYTRITGDNAATLTFTSNASVGILINYDHCQIDNLTIKGSGVASGDMVLGTPIYLQGVSFCKVLNNTIINAASSSIELQYGGSNGGATNNPCNYNEVSGNQIINPAGNLNDNSGIIVGYASIYSFVGNIIKNNVINGNHIIGKGILMLSSGNNNIFQSNVVSNVNAYGIASYGPATSADSSLRDNTFINNKIYSVGVLTGTTNFGSGIYNQKSYRAIITGNTIRRAGINSVATTLPVSGIALNNSSGAVVENNIIDSCVNTPGINAANIFIGATIGNNHIYNSQVGINVANSNHVTINHNQIFSVSSSGIYVSADTSGYSARPAKYVRAVTGNYFDISNNEINAASAGIQFAGQPYDVGTLNRISGNNVTSGYVSGAISTSYLTNSQITNNIINSTAATYGITVNASQSVNNDVVGNQLYNTTTYTVGILIVPTAHSVMNNYINSSTNQISVNSITYNNTDLLNGVPILSSNGFLNITANKTVTFPNTITFAGTDGTTLTFPSTSATIARTDATQTFTGNLLTSGNQVYDIGSSVNSFAHVYASNFASSGNVSFNAAATGQMYFQIAGTSYGQMFTNGHVAFGNVLADNGNLSVAGTIGIAGTTSGVISVSGQAAAGTYSFNLPTTAGTAGQFLTSQGGLTNAMTWTTPNFITALTGDATASGPGSAVVTLAASGATAGTYTNPTVTVNAKGLVTSIANGSASSGTVTNVSGTANRTTVTNGTTTPIVDIASNYAGQTSLTTLGTITTGVWNGTPIANTYLANSTISGVSLGSTLFGLSATNSTLTFSGAYTGAAAQTVGLNLANANTWTAPQTFSITNTASSGNNYGTQVLNTTNQTSTAAFTDFLVNRTNTASGTGAQNLADFQVGGSSKFSVSTAGKGVFSSYVQASSFSTNGTGNSLTSFDGVTVQNTYTATATNASLNSGRTRYLAELWNPNGTPAPNWANISEELRTASSASPAYSLYWSANLSTTATPGPFTDLMKLDQGGNLSLLTGLFTPHGYTVSTLPAASANTGSVAYVTDANAPAVGSAVAGGGTAKAMVWSNGASWTVTGI